MKIFLVLFLSLNYSFARIYSPKELAILAEERAPLIRMHLEGKNAATGQIAQAKTLANPVLIIQSGSLKSGTQAGAVVDVTVNQPIPWPGKMQARVESSEILKRISEVDLEESKLMINHSATLMSLEIATLTELEKHHQERKKHFSLIQKFLSTRPLPSPRQMVEKDLIETQIKLVENLMNELIARKNTLISELELLTGIESPEIKVSWKEVKRPSEKDFYLKKISENPTVKRTEKLHQYAQSKVEEARLEARPDILVGVNYRQENIAPTNHFYHAQVAVVIPIIDRGQHSVSSARANVRKEEASKRWVTQETQNLVSTHYESLIAAYQGTKLFQISNIHKMDKRFDMAREAFKKGRIDAMTFLQTDTQIHESFDLAYTSYLKYYTSLAQIMFLTGQKLEL